MAETQLRKSINTQTDEMTYITVEGFPATVYMSYPKGSPVGAKPILVFVEYMSVDVGERECCNHIIEPHPEGG